MTSRTGIETEACGLRRLLRAESADHRPGFSSGREGFRNQPATELPALGDKFVEERGHAFDDGSRAASGARGIGGITAEDDIGSPSVIEGKHLDDHLTLLIELLLVIHRLRDVLGDIDECRKASDREDRAAIHRVYGRAGCENSQRVQRMENGVGLDEPERDECRLHLHRRANIEDAIVKHPHQVERTRELGEEIAWRDVFEAPAHSAFHIRAHHGADAVLLREF